MSGGIKTKDIPIAIESKKTRVEVVWKQMEVTHFEEKIKTDCPEISVIQIAQAVGKRATRVAVHGAHLPGKLIQAKSSKSERRPQKTF